MLTNQSLGVRLLMAVVFSFALAAAGCDDGGGTAGSGGTGGVGGDGGGGVGGGGVGGDGGGGIGGSTGGTGGTPVGSVTATPSSTAFDPSVEVTLTADDAEATIYYTTDLSPVLDEDGNVQGTEYTAPLTITETTVLKFLAGTDSGAGGAGGDGGEEYSAEQSEGYTLATTDIRDQWARSGHGDLTGEAWRHWDEDGEVPSRCAKCHSAASNSPPVPSLGFLEYVTTGGNSLAAPLPLGLDCAACHERFPTIYSDLETYAYLEPVEFPSGAELTAYNSSNICMTCHQGRESGLDVQDAIDDDDGMGPYSFINIHYYPAAASMYGGEANGGFQYEGMDYRPRNTFPSHPGGFSDCVGCHMQNAQDGEAHTWIPGSDSCIGCHGGSSFETLGGSPVQSYNNIEALLVDLYDAIQDYAENTIGAPIIYDSSAYPYWFNDNGMGANYGNRYTDFDAKLLPAAYNYQVGQKDPAGYIHNGTYIQQVLHDSTVDLGGSTDVEVIGRGDLQFNGTDVGLASKSQQWQISAHGALGDEAFRHWDEDGEVPSFCSKCHTTAGFEEFATIQAPTAHVPVTGVDCWSCHASFDLFTNAETRWDVADGAGPGQTLEPVTFPSGAELTLNNNSNLCMSCHSGRSSGLDVRTADPNDATQSPDYDSFDFINIHYYAAAAVLFGGEADGGYQYRTDPNDPGTELVYQGQNSFVGFHTMDDVPGQGDVDLVDCIGCHMNSNPDNAQAKHTFMPAEVDDCSFCHSGGPTFKDLQTRPRSYWFAIDTLTTQLYDAIRAYADGGGLPITSPVFYDSQAYPYWFQDNGNGANYGNRYRDFDRTMLSAAYNYQVSQKDPGAYIHNGIYMQQILWDSIVAMGTCPNLNPPPPGRDPCVIAP